MFGEILVHFGVKTEGDFCRFLSFGDFWRSFGACFWKFWAVLAPDAELREDTGCLCKELIFNPLSDQWGDGRRRQKGEMPTNAMFLEKDLAEWGLTWDPPERGKAGLRGR